MSWASGTWAVNQRAGMTDLSFLDHLAGQSDPCFGLGAAETKRRTFVAAVRRTWSSRDRYAETPHRPSYPL